MPTVSKVLDDRFALNTLRAALPIAIWGVHFFIAYWVVQFACQLGFQQYGVFGVSWITVALWTLTAAAIAALVVMIVSDGRRIRAHGEPAEGEGVLMFVQIGIAIFALIGVLWSTVPILVAAPCANLYELNTAPLK